jgi:hypothetical protein
MDIFFSHRGHRGKKILLSVLSVAKIFCQEMARLYD